MWQNGKGEALVERASKVTSHQPIEISSNQGTGSKQMVASQGTGGIQTFFSSQDRAVVGSVWIFCMPGKSTVSAHHRQN